MKKINIFIIIGLVIAIAVIAFFIAGPERQGRRNERINEKVVYVKDGDGAYLYDMDNHKTTQIYKCTNKDEVFIDKEFKSTDGYVIVGVKGDRIFDTEKACHTFTEEYIAVNFDGSGFKKYNRKLYEELWDQHILKTYEFDYRTGTEALVSEIKLESTSSSYKGVVYNRPRGYSESNIVNGKQVFTREGKLYLKDSDNKESLLLDYKGRFDPKFGTGYYCPWISPDGTKILFCNLHGLDLIFNKPELKELDMNTMKVRLIKRNCLYPKYSPSGNYILYLKEGKYNKESTIYDYEIHVMKNNGTNDTYIGRGYKANWAYLSLK